MEAILELWGIFGLYYLGAGGIGIALYVLQALGLYTIANRRGIEHPWLAWIPVGSLWLLGDIADSYRHATRGEQKNRRTALLILSIVTVVLVILAFVTIAGSVINMILQAERTVYYDDGLMITQFVSILLSAIGLFLLAGVAAIVQAVLQYICLYELFASCDPDNKVLYLLLSLLFRLEAVFIFICRNKDLGMVPVMNANPYQGYRNP